LGRLLCQILLGFCLVATLPATLQAASQVVSLNSGERLVGEILPQSNEQTVVLKSDLLGEVSLPRASITKIEPEVVVVAAPVVVAVQPAPKMKAPIKPAVQLAAAADAEDAATAAEQAEIAEEERVVDKLRNIKSPDSWKGNVRVGLNLSQGDSRWTETNLRGNLDIQEKGSANFYRLNGSYTYRQTEKSNGDTYKSTDRSDGTFTYRRSISNAWFLQNSVGVRVDQVKGIDREIQELVGLGYKYKPSNKFEFLLGGGGGVEDYQVNFVDSRAGLNTVLNVFQELTWRPLQRTSIVQKFNYYWNPDAPQQFNYVLSAALRIRLTDLLGLEFSFNRNFDNDVGNGKSKDEAQWRNALVVYF
jgi:hypothetical protein